MSVYFYSTAWVYAKDPKKLGLITDEELIKLACLPRNSDSEGEVWLTEARKDRAGKIEKRTPNMMKIYAGGSNGQCLSASELSELHPEFLFIVTSGADCSEDLNIRFVKSGKCVKNFSILDSDSEIIPELLSFEDLESSDFAKIESFFDKNIELKHKLNCPIHGEAFLEEDIFDE